MRTVNNYLTPEQVLVSSTHTGFQQYHGDTRLGDIAVVYARDNNGILTYLPPTITIGGEQFFLASVKVLERCKLYFRPWDDQEVVDSFLDQTTPAPGVTPVDNSSCILCAFERADFSPVTVEGEDVERDFFPAENPRTETSPVGCCR